MIEGDLESSIFIDLFSGTGAVGLEAMSRGAQGVLFIEKNESTRRVLQTNLHTALQRFEAQDLNPPPWKVLSLDVEEDRRYTWWKTAQQWGGSPILFVDPPYANSRVFVISFLQRFSFDGPGVLILELPKEEAKETVELACAKSPQWKVEKRKEYGKAHIIFLYEEGVPPSSPPP